MKWSFKLGRISGIDIYIHATFLILLGWVALSYWGRGAGSAGAIRGVVFTLMVFGVVVLHELGHALAARRYGIRTRDITLWPIGGVARIERMPDQPRQELLVALAGPLVNVALAAVLWGVMAAVGTTPALARMTLTGGSILNNLFWVNVSLAVFNLLPAFPMDGGRVLRAALAMRMDAVRATEIAARVGQGMALLFGAAGLFLNPMLVFIALFVWMGASQEASASQLKAALDGIAVERAMIRDVHTVGPGDSLSFAVDAVLAGFQQDFPVVEDARVVGVLTRRDMLRVLAERGGSVRIGEVMQREYAVAEPSEMLASAFQRLLGCECHTLPVVRGGQLVGVLTMDQIGEFVMVQSALKTRAAVATG